MKTIVFILTFFAFCVEKGNSQATSKIGNPGVSLQIQASGLNLPSVYSQLQSTVFVNYKPKFGTITFDYPSGWTVAKKDKVKQAYTENYYLQPENQEFEGKNGEVVIRIFDPVSIMEDTKSLSAAFSLSLFNKFVVQITEGTPPPTQTVTVSGKTYYECTQNNSDFVTKIIGTRSVNGNLYVVAMAAAPTIDAENNNILYKVAQSIRGGEPNNTLTVQESAIKNWYAALARGNGAELKALSCEAANQGNSLLSIAEQIFGTPNSQNIIINAAKSFDFSNLKFYTVGGNSSLVVVRVCGNIIAPNKQIKSFFNFSNAAGGTNLFVIKLENGSWKVCQSAGR